MLYRISINVHVKYEPRCQLFETLAFILKDLLTSLQTPVNKDFGCIAVAAPILWPEYVLVGFILPIYTIPT